MDKLQQFSPAAFPSTWASVAAVFTFSGFSRWFRWVGLKNPQGWVPICPNRLTIFKSSFMVVEKCAKPSILERCLKFLSHPGQAISNSNGKIKINGSPVPKSPKLWRKKRVGKLCKRSSGLAGSPWNREYVSNRFTKGSFLSLPPPLDRLFTTMSHYEPSLTIIHHWIDWS